MCNCISETKKAALEHLQKDKAPNIVLRAHYKCVGYNMTDGSATLYNDIEYEMTTIKKDGSTGATRKYLISIYHTYCPFCGKKIKEDERQPEQKTSHD